MKKTFNKVGVLILALLLMTSVLPFSAMAANVIDVELNGINVTAAEDTIGAGAATIGEDYTTVLTASEGYEIISVGVHAPYNDDALHPDFDFDYETGILTVSTNGLLGADGIVINATAGKKFNYETDVTDISELPYSASIVLEETDIIKEVGFAAKIFKVELASDEKLDIKFFGTYTDFEHEISDTAVKIYTYNDESGLKYEDRMDGHFGIEGVFTPEDAGIYYFAAMCYNEYIGGRFSLELSIYEEPNNEEELTPTPGSGTGSGSSSGSTDADDIIIDVIIPDVENPDIPNTSVESNATAFAVLSLTVGGALALTFKRKKK